jgi:glycosyltransferase involved in cell wall biosynthesis
LKRHVLTIAIPTFNRSLRLAKNLERVREEISQFELENKVALLVSDNNSTDDTHEICLLFAGKYLDSGIDFQYTQNGSNLGFSSNVIESYFRTNSGYTLFFSDDDNLRPGFLHELIKDIEQYKFSVAIYNFTQPPYGEENLLIKDSCLIRGDQALGGLASLITWPKLSGLVLRNNHEAGRYDKIRSQISPDNVVGHVLLAIDQIKHDPNLYMSSAVAAYPDEDYREHVNFVSYIGNYIRRDLKEYCALVGVTNSKIISAIEAIPLRNIVLYSLHALSLYYRSQTKLTRKMKNEVIQNIVGYLFGRKMSHQGLVLEKPYQSWAKIRTIFYLLYILSLAVKARFTKRKLYLMNEAF